MHAILLALNAASIAVAAFLVFTSAGDDGGRTQSSIAASMAGADATGMKRFSPAR